CQVGKSESDVPGPDNNSICCIRLPHPQGIRGIGRTNLPGGRDHETTIAMLLAWTVQLSAQDMESCPMHKDHAAPSQHQADVEKHGDQAMGFPHDKTTHHFRLYPDGGAVEITANDAADSQNVQAIRSHLARIATLFSQGDFSIPMFIHDQVPPGVPAMR